MAEVTETSVQKRPMTLIEGMKEMKLILKKMQRNSERIGELSSLLSNERPKMESEDEQKKTVASLAQANKDLLRDYLVLHARVTRTNLETVVKIGGSEYTIDSLLLIRRKLADAMVLTYKAMSDKSATARLRNQSDQVTVVQMFDEKTKAAEIDFWLDFKEQIDPRLESVNAITVLLTV